MNGEYCTDGVSNNAKIQEEMMEEMLQKVNDLSALSIALKDGLSVFKIEGKTPRLRLPSDLHEHIICTFAHARAHTHTHTHTHKHTHTQTHTNKRLGALAQLAFHSPALEPCY